MKPSLYILGHLGCGDHLLTAAIVRHFNKDRDVSIPVKHHNVPSVRFMFRDLHGVTIIPVDGDDDAVEIRDHREAHGMDTLSLGQFGKDFDWARWDVSMFEQAGLPPELRWEGFYVERDPHAEVWPRYESYIFVHHDPHRGFIIDPEKLPKTTAMVAHPATTIFDWCGVIEHATEIHVIDSSFLALVDLMPKLDAKRFVLHAYATEAKYGNSPAREPTMLRRPWEVIQQ